MKHSLTKGQEITYNRDGQTLKGRVVRPNPDSDGDIIIEKYSEYRKAFTKDQCYIQLDDVIVQDTLKSFDSGSIVYVNKDADLVSSDVPQSVIKNRYTDSSTTTKEKPTMTNRSVVNVTLIDTDAGLKPENSVVADLGQFVVENGNTDHVKQRILMDTKLDIAGKLEAHNRMRGDTVDLEVLKRTGNKVKLQPVEIFQLEWSFK